MDNSAWQKLFQSFRPDDQTDLVIACTGTTEIAVQNIAKAESEMVMIRGRISGQADNGRLFLLPYDRIMCVYVNREVFLEEADLFSCDVPIDRKNKLAQAVAEQQAKALADAIGGDQKRRNDPSAAPNIKDQLERLRERAGFSKGEDAKSAAPAEPTRANGAPQFAPNFSQRNESPEALPPPGSLTSPNRPSPTVAEPLPALPQRMSLQRPPTKTS